MQRPNLTYIEKLANGDHIFLLDFIAIIRNEFPEEKELYYRFLNEGDLATAAECVHKIKHKFGILGLTDAYSRAVMYEESLLNGDTAPSVRFDEDLNKVETYLNAI